MIEKVFPHQILHSKRNLDNLSSNPRPSQGLVINVLKSSLLRPLKSKKKLLELRESLYIRRSRLSLFSKRVFQEGTKYKFKTLKSRRISKLTSFIECHGFVLESILFLYLNFNKWI